MLPVIRHATAHALCLFFLFRVAAAGHGGGRGGRGKFCWRTGATFSASVRVLRHGAARAARLYARQPSASATADARKSGAERAATPVAGAVVLAYAPLSRINVVWLA